MTSIPGLFTMFISLYFRAYSDDRYLFFLFLFMTRPPSGESLFLTGFQ